MNTWLANNKNQEALLNDFLKRRRKDRLEFLNHNQFMVTDLIPFQNSIYILSLIKKKKKTDTNKLPFDALNVRAIINTAGTISKWNESTSKYDGPETIHVNSVISFYPPFNFTKVETITVGLESITMTPTFTLNNNFSQLQNTRNDPSKHLPYAFSTNPLFQIFFTKFLLNPSTPIVIITPNYQEDLITKYH